MLVLILLLGAILFLMGLNLWFWEAIWVGLAFLIGSAAWMLFRLFRR